MSAPFDLLLRECWLAGRIAEVGALAGHPAGREIACEGRVVTPGLVDAHIHLDKALLNDRAPSREGSLAEALRVTGEAKRAFTPPDVQARARRVLDMAIDQAPPRCAATPRSIPLSG